MFPPDPVCHQKRVSCHTGMSQRKRQLLTQANPVSHKGWARPSPCNHLIVGKVTWAEAQTAVHVYSWVKLDHHCWSNTAKQYCRSYTSSNADEAMLQAILLKQCYKQYSRSNATSNTAEAMLQAILLSNTAEAILQVILLKQCSMEYCWSNTNSNTDNQYCWSNTLSNTAEAMLHRILLKQY